MNLVVSAVGLRAAKVLREKFGMPYVIGTPNQWMVEEISNALDKAVVRQPEQPTVYLQNRMQQDADITPVSYTHLDVYKRQGRLFDAVSAILGIRRQSSFEGEASTACLLYTSRCV